MLTIYEIVSRMPNAKYFSKLDATSGLWKTQYWMRRVLSCAHLTLPKEDLDS